MEFCTNPLTKQQRSRVTGKSEFHFPDDVRLRRTVTSFVCERFCLQYLFDAVFLECVSQGPCLAVNGHLSPMWLSLTDGRDDVDRRRGCRGIFRVPRQGGDAND